MTRRAVALFAAMSVVWGVPYLMIKVAVDELAPAVVVAGRTSLAALVLVPIAWRRGAIGPALRRWRPLLAFTALELALPWLLLAHAEQTLPSGLTGMLVACVPLGGMVTARLLGDRRALRPVRLLGLALGLGGVALLVGLDLRGGDRWAVLEVMLVVGGYATAPFIVDRKLRGVPSIGIIATSLAAVALVYTPVAAVQLPATRPSASALAAVVVLAGLCTGLAFVLFFALIAEAGPARASLITFVNPAVAVTAGVLFAGEAFGAATGAGFVLVLAGCWFATRSDPAGAPADEGEPIGADAPLPAGPGPGLTPDATPVS